MPRQAISYQVLQAMKWQKPTNREEDLLRLLSSATFLAVSPYVEVTFDIAAVSHKHPYAILCENYDAIIWITPFLRMFIPGRAEHVMRRARQWLLWLYKLC